MFAVLANPESRRVAAEMMLGASLTDTTAGLSPSRRRRVTDALVQSGLVDAETGRFLPDVFGATLAATAAPRREGVEVLTEREVNERLLAHSDDVAVLRRYLVDYRLVERRSDGTEYALTGEGPSL